MIQNIFKGHIYFHKNGKDHPLISFDECPSNSSDNVISLDFKEIPFTEEERHFLTTNIKYYIFNFTNLNEDHLRFYSEKLARSINSCEEEIMNIKAKGYGTFICLMALYEGSIHPEKSVSFDLYDPPLALFPKKFIRTISRKFHKITVHHKKDSWLYPFKSLWDATPHVDYDSVLYDKGFKKKAS